MKPSLVNEQCFEAELNTEHFKTPKRTDPKKLAQELMEALEDKAVQCTPTQQRIFQMSIRQLN